MKTRYHSFKEGKLARGCQQCVKGDKSVLFITGICSRKPLCNFCPLSDKKIRKDDIYINEWKVNSIKEIKKEIDLCSSKGVGITGGDPLCKLDRTLKTIKNLKKTYGEKFHIHLYTPLNLVTISTLKKLYDAGLDEIRFHPDLENDKLWERINLAKEFRWDIGIEIPIFPDKIKETKKLIDYIKDKVDFLNLNELEVADNKISTLTKQGYKTKDRLSYAVLGSIDAGKKILLYSKGKIKNVHLCSAKLKDNVQLRERIKKRAKSVKKGYDIITKEGTLFRGAIYSNKNLVKLRKELMKEYDIPKELIDIDKERKRILTMAGIVDELKTQLKKEGLKIALVEEYPTYDVFPVMKDYLS